MSDQELIRKKMRQIEDLLLRKNRDYGSSFRKAGILSGALDAKSKLLVRLDDKLERLANLIEKGTDGDVADESVGDTVVDAIGYFVLFSILLDEEKSRGKTHSVETHSAKPMSVIEAEERMEHSQT